MKGMCMKNPVRLLTSEEHRVAPYGATASKANDDV